MAEGALRRWCSRPKLPPLRGMQILSVFLLVAFLGSLVLWLAGSLGAIFPFGAFLAQIGAPPRFDEGRQELMKAQLKRFRDLPNVIRAGS